MYTRNGVGCFAQLQPLEPGIILAQPLFLQDEPEQHGGTLVGSLIAYL